MGIGRIFILSLVLSLPGIAVDKPNVILVVTDDQGYGDLGCHGNARVKTPELDKLQAESIPATHVRFNLKLTHGDADVEAYFVDNTGKKHPAYYVYVDE